MQRGESAPVISWSPAAAASDVCYEDGLADGATRRRQHRGRSARRTACEGGSFLLPFRDTIARVASVVAPAEALQAERALQSFSDGARRT